MPSTIRQHGVAPTRVSLHVLINLPTSIVFSQASSTVSTLDMLNSIRGRSEPHISTYWAAKLARTMDLHVHVQFILAVELSVAFGALIGYYRKPHVSSLIGGNTRGGDSRNCIPRGVIRWLMLTTTIHATHATRHTDTFGPLIAAEATRCLVNSTAWTVSCHDCDNIIASVW